MKHFIRLTTSDSGEKIYVNADEISAVYRDTGRNWTVIHYRSLRDMWIVRETPEEIFKMLGVPLGAMVSQLEQKEEQ